MLRLYIIQFKIKKNLAIERQRQVINKMIKYGNLDKVEAEKIIK